MTREEQLDWLCRLRSEIYVYMPKEWLIPMNNALDMAIKALEQEPNIDMECDEIKILQKRSYLEGFHEAHKMLVKQEPCADVVSRQAVLNEFYDMENLYERIKQLPSVRPQEQTGKWKFVCQKKIGKIALNAEQGWLRQRKVRDEE